MSHMENVRDILQKNGITLSRFSEIMDISRPTLNSYIKMYESDLEIPSEKYQIIFKELFDEDLSPDIFIKKIKKYEKMLQRDKAMGIFDLDSETTDLFTSVIENIKDDFHTSDYDEKIYVFINMLITNYRSEEIFRHVVEYFLVLNGFENYEKIDFSEKTYLLQYFSMFEKDKTNKLEYDSYLKSKFISRIKEIQEINNNTTDVFKNEILKLLNDEIKSFNELGIKPSKEELLKIILSKIDES